MMRRFRLLILVVLAAAAVAPAAAQQRRTITEKDLFKFVWVADPQISPDGSQVAFVRVTRRREEGRYDTVIWIAKTDGSEPPRAITSGIRDTGAALVARWPPAGVRAIRREGRPARSRRRSTSWRWPAASRGRSPTCRAAPATRSGRPTARTIAFSSTATPGGARSRREGLPPTNRARRDVRVITEAVYRANGVGGVRLRRSRSAVAHLDRGGSGGGRRAAPRRTR